MAVLVDPAFDLVVGRIDLQLVGDFAQPEDRLLAACGLVWVQGLFRPDQLCHRFPVPRNDDLAALLDLLQEA